MLVRPPQLFKSDQIKDDFVRSREGTTEEIRDRLRSPEGTSSLSTAKDEAERKAPLLVQLIYGLSAFTIPMIVSGIYRGFGFNTSLDILGIVFSVNAVAFTIHARSSEWGPNQRMGPKRVEEERLIPQRP